MKHTSSQHQNQIFQRSGADRHIHTLADGNIKKQLISLTFPLLIGNILQQFYNMTDSVVISHFCGTPAFAASGIAGTVMNLFLFVVGGGCTGISMILASFYGKQDIKNFRKECFVSLTIGLILTIALSIASILTLPFILHLMQTPPEIFPYVTNYLNLILGGLPAAFLYNLCASILRAIGNTKYALLFLLISIGINVLLDLILVGGFRLGIAAAALATVISQLLSAFLCFCYIKKAFLFCCSKKKTFIQILSYCARLYVMQLPQHFINPVCILVNYLFRVPSIHWEQNPSQLILQLGAWKDWQMHLVTADLSPSHFLPLKTQVPASLFKLLFM